MVSLEGFARKQEEIIKKLKEKKAEGQKEVIKIKMVEIERKVEEVLGRDRLMELWVRLQYELDTLNHRKDKMQEQAGKLAQRYR